MQVNQTWTAVVGSHTLEVVADSSNLLFENAENNNTSSSTLPEVIDVTAPQLVGTMPPAGAIVQAVDTITINLIDQDGSIDDAFVIDSLKVRDGSGRSVTGTIAESNDQFTYTPGSGPYSDGQWQVSLTARDVAGNSADYDFGFTLDSLDPATPSITGGTVLSGRIQERPVENSSNQSAITPVKMSPLHNHYRYAIMYFDNVIRYQEFEWPGTVVEAWFKTVDLFAKIRQSKDIDWC